MCVLRDVSMQTAGQPALAPAPEVASAEAAGSSFPMWLQSDRMSDPELQAGSAAIQTTQDSLQPFSEPGSIFTSLASRGWNYTQARGRGHSYPSTPGQPAAATLRAAAFSINNSAFHTTTCRGTKVGRVSGSPWGGAPACRATSTRASTATRPASTAF